MRDSNFNSDEEERVSFLFLYLTSTVYILVFPSFSLCLDFV